MSATSAFRSHGFDVHGNGARAQQAAQEGQVPVQRKPASGHRSQAPLRLTRRGKVVLIGIPLVLLAALLLSLAGFFNSPAKASDSTADLTVTPTVTVTVQPGESLWGIASDLAPERDARDVVADIVQLNNLSAGKILPGQQLYIPTR